MISLINDWFIWKHRGGRTIKCIFEGFEYRNRVILIEAASDKLLVHLLLQRIILFEIKLSFCT